MFKKLLKSRHDRKAEATTTNPIKRFSSLSFDDYAYHERPTAAPGVIESPMSCAPVDYNVSPPSPFTSGGSVQSPAPYGGIEYAQSPPVEYPQSKPPLQTSPRQPPTSVAPVEYPQSKPSFQSPSRPQGSMAPIEYPQSKPPLQPSPDRQEVSMAPLQYPQSQPALQPPPQSQISMAAVEYSESGPGISPDDTSPNLVNHRSGALSKPFHMSYNSPDPLQLYAIELPTNAPQIYPPQDHPPQSYFPQNYPSSNPSDQSFPQQNHPAQELPSNPSPPRHEHPYSSHRSIPSVPSIPNLPSVPTTPSTVSSSARSPKSFWSNSSTTGTPTSTLPPNTPPYPTYPTHSKPPTLPPRVLPTPTQEPVYQPPTQTTKPGAPHPQEPDPNASVIKHTLPIFCQKKSEPSLLDEELPRDVREFRLAKVALIPVSAGERRFVSLDVVFGEVDKTVAGFLEKHYLITPDSKLSRYSSSGIPASFRVWKIEPLKVAYKGYSSLVYVTFKSAEDETKFQVDFERVKNLSEYC